MNKAEDWVASSAYNAANRLSHSEQEHQDFTDSYRQISSAKTFSFNLRSSILASFAAHDVPLGIVSGHVRVLPMAADALQSDSGSLGSNGPGGVGGGGGGEYHLNMMRRTAVQDIAGGTVHLEHKARRAVTKTDIASTPVRLARALARLESTPIRTKFAQNENEPEEPDSDLGANLLDEDELAGEPGRNRTFNQQIKSRKSAISSFLRFRSRSRANP